jgi:hypothetical protein
LNLFSYSGLEVFDRKLLPRSCRALEGSRLEVVFRSTRPVELFELELDDDARVALSADEEGWYSYERTLTEPITFWPLLQDEHGIQNSERPRCHVSVYPDRPPVVQIKAPAKEVSLRPEETIEVEFKATDDFGIARAELLVSTQDEDGVRTDVIPVEMGDQQGEKEFEVQRGTGPQQI